MLKDVKKDEHIFIINNSEDYHIDDAIVMDITPPKATIPIPGKPATMCFDLTLKWDDGEKQKTFNIPETLSVAYSNDYIICCDKQHLVSELEKIKGASQEVIDSVPKHKVKIAKTEEYLAQYSEQYKEKLAIEERFSKIESTMYDIHTMLERALSK